MGGCLRVFIRTPVPPGDPHSTILAFDASSIVDKSCSCHRRRPLPTRAADLSKCCYNSLPQDAQSGHCCDKLWAWEE